MDLELKARRALVLSSSRGLGLGIAEALAAEGADVVLTGRSRQRLAENCERINARGNGRASFVTADLADPGFAPTLHAAAVETLGSVDILVNNTGGPPPGGAVGMDPQTLQTQFEMMVKRVVELTNLVLPAMREAGWGRILTVASSGVVQPIPNLALSNTIRSALVGWSKSLSSEIAGDGVTANLLIPGRIQTERVDELDAANAAKTGASIDDVKAASRKTIPAGRNGEVSEFAAVAAFLVSGPASYVTGSVVRCDGGSIRSV